jgi:hypothetical protein
MVQKIYYDILLFEGLVLMSDFHQKKSEISLSIFVVTVCPFDLLSLGFSELLSS